MNRYKKVDKPEPHRDCMHGMNGMGLVRLRLRLRLRLIQIGPGRVSSRRSQKPDIVTPLFFTITRS